MAKFNFNLREPESKRETPLNMVIRWNNQKLVYSTGLNINPQFWDKTTQRAKNTKRFAASPEFNESLSNIEAQVLKSFRDFENDNLKQPTIEELRERLNITTNRVNKPVQTDLFTFIEKFRSDSVNKVNRSTGKTFAVKTQTAYKQLHELLIEFSGRKRKPINFNDIDFEFYIDFVQFLTTEKEFSVNYIGKHIKTLKTILNDALERGITDNQKFKSKKFAVLKQETDSVYLNLEELEELGKVDFSNNPRLDRVRDLFLVGCYTGLRFSDLSKISEENIKGDFIELETQKTADKIAVPIHPVVNGIMTKYVETTGKAFPEAYSNQKMNEYIKEVCRLVKGLKSFVSVKENKAGVTYSKKYQKFELITTHTARRSFASNNYKLGFPMHIIMAVTGHKTEKSFMSYIKITPTEKAEVMRINWAKMSNLKVS